VNSLYEENLGSNIHLVFLTYNGSTIPSECVNSSVVAVNSYYWEICRNVHNWSNMYSCLVSNNQPFMDICHLHYPYYSMNLIVRQTTLIFPLFLCIYLMLFGYRHRRYYKKNKDTLCGVKSITYYKVLGKLGISKNIISKFLNSFDYFSFKIPLEYINYDETHSEYIRTIDLCNCVKGVDET